LSVKYVSQLDSCGPPVSLLGHLIEYDMQKETEVYRYTTLCRFTFENLYKPTHIPPQKLFKHFYLHKQIAYSMAFWELQCRKCC